MPLGKDYYAILGVEPHATEDEINGHYSFLEQILTAKLSDPENGKKAEEQLKNIKEAYRHLRDPQSRRKYDATRSSLGTWPPLLFISMKGARRSEAPGAGGEVPPTPSRNDLSIPDLVRRLKEYFVVLEIPGVLHYDADFVHSENESRLEFLYGPHWQSDVYTWISIHYSRKGREVLVTSSWGLQKLNPFGTRFFVFLKRLGLALLWVPATWAAVTFSIVFTGRTHPVSSVVVMLGVLALHQWADLKVKRQQPNRFNLRVPWLWFLYFSPFLGMMIWGLLSLVTAPYKPNPVSVLGLMLFVWLVPQACRSLFLQDLPRTPRWTGTGFGFESSTWFPPSANETQGILNLVFDALDRSLAPRQV